MPVTRTTHIVVFSWYVTSGVCFRTLVIQDDITEICQKMSELIFNKRNWSKYYCLIFRVIEYDCTIKLSNNKPNNFNNIVGKLYLNSDVMLWGKKLNPISIGHWFNVDNIIAIYVHAREFYLDKNYFWLFKLNCQNISCNIS